VVVLPELAEISLGNWDGLSWAEIEHRYPDQAAAKLRDWLGVTPPGGEPWSGFTARVDSALASIRAQTEPAAIVAHLTVNAWIAHTVAGADPTAFLQDYAQVLEWNL
jgi:probable phosphoglycerate mutase